MPRYSQKRAKKIVDSYNAAIRRAQKSTKLTELEKKLIPQKVNFKTLAAMTSSKDRDRMLDYLQMAKGGIKQFKAQEINPGVFATKYQLDVAHKQINLINRDRAKRRRELKEVNKDNPDFNRISFRPETYKDQRDLNVRLSHMYEQAKEDFIEEQQAVFMGRYFESLIKAFGDAGANMVDDIIAQGLTAGEMYERIVAMDIADITYVYGTAKTGSGSQLFANLSEAFDLESEEYYFEE